MTHYIQQCIKDIEEYCKKNNLQHRFVGGVSYGGLLNKNSTYAIDLSQKKIQIHQHNELVDLRKDGTAKDIDLIVIEPNKEKVVAFQEHIYKLQKTMYKKYNFDVPISLEPAVYRSNRERNWLTQFVTAIEVEESAKFGKGSVSFAFEDLKQKIAWNTLEAWTVELENGLKYTTRNPIADYYAYFFRSPGGVKLKDINKIVYLKKLADDVVEMGKQTHPPIDYFDDRHYGTWKTYIKRLHESSSITIRAKSLLMRAYWNTIGTYLAHGKGITKVLSKLATKFTGV
jgi:hypothetical protein